MPYGLNGLKLNHTHLVSEYAITVGDLCGASNQGQGMYIANPSVIRLYADGKVQLCGIFGYNNSNHSTPNPIGYQFLNIPAAYRPGVGLARHLVGYTTGMSLSGTFKAAISPMYITTAGVMYLHDFDMSWVDYIAIDNIYYYIN